ncbi:MAG TPA: acyl-CoA thioesterase domain-containing protein [Streptosporangiaceae bacterium]|nr:acyl-CoA thioesterase domain-containing protein [Streptosporangiaceae bacterium]
MPSLTDPVTGTDETGLPELLSLERIEDNLFRTVVVNPEPAGLFGGQVAAQALRAAGETVPDGRHPHSLHGYFLSRGDASRRVLLTVHRDRDGGSYSNRRVIAVQDGKVIFNLAGSFHVSEEGSDYQAHRAPDVETPDDLPDDPRWHRMHGVEIRLPSQPQPAQQWPSRLWIRSRHKLDGDMMHAGALAYVSDMFTGLAAAPGVAIAGPLTSIDHSVWFFRKAALDDWVLMDLQPESTAGGRGMYTGRIFSRDGNLAAAIAQETLFRPGIARD